MVNYLRQQSKVIKKKKDKLQILPTFVCTICQSPEVTSKSSVNSAKQAGHLFSPQSSLVIVYANGMYGMLASAHNDSDVATQHP